jgi:hypothetical protein
MPTPQNNPSPGENPEKTRLDDPLDDYLLAKSKANETGGATTAATLSASSMNSLTGQTNRASKRSTHSTSLISKPTYWRSTVGLLRQALSALSL